MKKAIIVLAVSLVALSFSSCKKCVTCKIQNINGTVEAEYDEYCGTAEEIRNFKADLENKSQAQLGANGQVICIDSK